MKTGIDPIFAIGVVSKNLFSLDIYNLYPLFLTWSIAYYLKGDDLKKYLMIIVPIYFLAILFNNNYIYLLVGIILFIFQSIIFYKNNDYKLIPILICAYALSYSLIITDEFEAGRLNFHFDLIISCFISLDHL